MRQKSARDAASCVGEGWGIGVPPRTRVPTLTVPCSWGATGGWARVRVCRL